MIRAVKTVFLLSSACIGVHPWVSSCAAIDLLSVAPQEDTNAILHNPGMGWVIYENYPVDPDPHGSSTMLTLPNDDFPEVDAVAIMFSWQDVEPSEGSYDFSKVDRAYDYWRKRGKEIQLRASTESLVWWSNKNPPAGKGMPDYVLAKLPPNLKQTRQMEGQSYEVVDARLPFYQRRLGAFLRALNEHFGGARPVSLIDLRGFGVWGEWHSGFRYSDLKSRRMGLKAVINIWSEALPQRMLALSYSYDPDGPKEFYAGPYNRFDSAFTTNYSDFLSFSAFDYALTKTNITFRRDGCGGAVHSNERKLNEETFTKHHRAPMFGEFLGSYSSIKKGGTNWVNWVMEDALSLHPNYLAMLGWQAGEARAFANERPDLVAHGLRNMGYRLVPTRVSFPSKITTDIAFQIDFEWVNRAAGRALKDFELGLLLQPKQDQKKVSSSPFKLPTTDWLRGQTYSTSHRVKFRGAAPGRYELSFLLRDPESKRTIALPLSNGSSEKVYRIGDIDVR